MNIVRATLLSLLFIVTEVNTTTPQQENGLKFVILLFRVVQLAVMKICARLMAVVTKCTVKGLVANETEGAVMAISAAVTQCGAI